MMESVLEELDLFYEVSDEQKKFFSEKGFIILKDVLSSTFLDYFIPEFTKKVVELNDLTKPMEERTTYEKAFLQVINLWTHSEIIKSFVMGKRLGSIAKQVNTFCDTLENCLNLFVIFFILVTAS